MALTIGDNFSYQGAKPLDGRIKYSTLAEMVAMPDSTLYDGCIAYCVGEDKNYQWKSTNTVDPDTGKWREFTSGGGSEYTAGDGISISNNTISTDSSVYRSADAAEATIADDDYFPFYDTSATVKRKSLWSNIKAKLKAYFDTLYATLNGHTIEDPEGTALTQRDTLQFGGDLEVSDDDENEKTVVSPHELTAAELAEIVTPLPGQPTQGITIDLRGNERVVGKVIESDGTEKTLYQKTVTGLNIKLSWNQSYATTTDLIDPLISDVSKIISVPCAHCKHPSSTDTYCINVVLQVTASNKWKLYSIDDHIITDITIQYTKTAS